MTKSEPISEMTDAELDALMALAMGWKLVDDLMGSYWTDETKDKHPTILISPFDYHPTSNTTEGKAQCFDLMVKFGLIVDCDAWLVYYQTKLSEIVNVLDYGVTDISVNRAICEAIALSRGEEV